MDPALRLQPGQQALTPAQEAEARRFADEYIHKQLSTERVDEQEAEALLRQAYQVAGLAPPQHIHWLDGPRQLVVALAPFGVADSLTKSVSDSTWASLWASHKASHRASAWDRVERSVRNRVKNRVWDSISDRVQASVYDHVGASIEASILDDVGDSSVEASVVDSLNAYENASWLAFYRFFDVYLAPNDLHALARLNPLVSGYWLGQEAALVVRRPRLLCRDAVGRLHNETGKCVEYHDGWGWYAWHGVRVPEQVIRAPEQLTREAFLGERDVEVRRVIQERMGQRFVWELEGKFIDGGPRGVLYEVALPDDPEGVARFVQVQDASTNHSYLPLRAAHHPDRGRSHCLELWYDGAGLWPIAGNLNQASE